MSSRESATHDTVAAEPVEGDGDAGTESLGRGALVGRYVVLGRLGQGGMGVVHAAYDPELDRKVALKLLHPRGRAGSRDDDRARLLREAQALAKLSHPNVVTVHDVGTLADRVWIAMEFVDGATLSSWRSQTAPSRADVLSTLVAVGRGVAAAHAAGLVHRDLKPDNIMVGVDGRVRVMDFGLARAEHEPTGASPDTIARPEVAALAMHMTRAGTLLGTPAYMAPEQLLGESAGPAADQFSFCVTAWESLFGVRPFAGESLLELAAAVLNGRVQEPPPRAKASRWLRRLLLRGLAREPARRFPSMVALVDALERGQAQARRRRWAVGLTAAVAIPAAVWGNSALETRRRAEGCRELGASIATVWPGHDATVRERTEQAILATGVAYAPATMEKIIPWLDEWSSAWRDVRTRTCVSHEIEGSWDADLRARADECLDEHRMELEALVAQLGEADAAMVERAVQAAAGLERGDECGDAGALAKRAALPQGGLEELRAVRAKLAHASMLARAGKNTDALAVVEEALARADALGWPPLSASARLDRGSLLARLARYEQAEAELIGAYVDGGKAAATETVGRAATMLIQVVGIRRAHRTEALVWGRAAEIAVAALEGDAEGLYTVQWLNDLAAIHHSMGEHAQATALIERGLAIREQLLGHDHPEIAGSLSNLAAVRMATGQRDIARPLMERALAIRESNFGPDHPLVAASLMNLGVMLLESDETVEAEPLLARALALREQALGKRHPEVALALNNLAACTSANGDVEGAKAMHERALAIRTATLGDRHPEVADSLYNIANLQRDLGEYDEAMRSYRRALEVQEEALGPDHPAVAITLVALGRTLTERGHARDAAPLLERALSINERTSARPDDTANSRFRLAQALWSLGRERARAITLAEQALAGYREVIGAGPHVLVVQEWLAQHPSP